jgi:hypothetical protein
MVAERDARDLPYDYIDLEQMLPASISRALDTQSGYGTSGELRTHVDELQREIWWSPPGRRRWPGTTAQRTRRGSAAKPITTPRWRVPYGHAVRSGAPGSG